MNTHASCLAFHVGDWSSSGQLLFFSCLVLTYGGRLKLSRLQL